MYLNSTFLKVDIVEAYQWLLLSSWQGDGFAIDTLLNELSLRPPPSRSPKASVAPSLLFPARRHDTTDCLRRLA